MNDLSILHLSDLHINGTGQAFSKLLKGLLGDIKKEISYIPQGRLVIAVTGDIIHKGEKNSIAAAKNFFKQLKEAVGDKVAGIYIVPGNHDKKRTDENQFLIPAYRSVRNLKGTEFGEAFYHSLWPLQLQSYSKQFGSGYLELTEYVYNLFDMNIEKDFVKNTFGIDIISIGGQDYCFVLLNTAWSCLDDNDTRNLIFGDFQMQNIKKQFRILTDTLSSSPCLTFVLGHHPISCLHGMEEDRIFAEMISFEELNANAYLCGHTHDRNVINWYNSRHSLSTLMTGIGWPESGSGMHVGDHYYSIYNFNIDINSLDISVRNTNDGGKFYPDFRIYTNGDYTEKKNLVFPIHAQEAHSYVQLSTADDTQEKDLYISNDFLKYSQIFSSRINKFCQEAGRWLEIDKNNLYESLELEGVSTKTEDSEQEEIGDEILYNYLFAKGPETLQENTDILDRIFSINQEILFDMYLGFLQRICQRLQKILTYDQLSGDDILRFHFRYLSDRNTYLYSNLCSSFSKETDQAGYGLSDFKYQDLIEAAHKSNKCLIYSVNEQLCNSKLKEKWKNFITVVPKFSKNKFKRKISEDVTKIVPYITFGVTINNNKFEKLLYCLDFYSINTILGNLLETYANQYKINIDKFCVWMKELHRKEVIRSDTDDTTR